MVIGWYVHHHGFGHIARLLAVRPHVRTSVVVFSSLPRPAGLDAATEWIELPGDADTVESSDGSNIDPRDADPTARGHLHWAPHDHPGHRARLATIAATASQRGLAAFVVDVSAEVVAFARLLGLRTIAVTQPGARTDAPHALAYALADRIVAPWAHGAVPTPALAAHGDRVVWTGGISRYDGRAAEQPSSRRSVLLLGRVLEPAVRADVTDRLTARGWRVDAVGYDDASRIDDPWPLLTRSTVVVSAAGQNSVADLAASGSRAVVVAQARPFDEQRATADALQRWGLARRADEHATAESLVDHIERAAGAEPDWSRWQVAGAAERMAAAVEAVLP
ncbi:hypothetical protein [Microbacterium trichothecenolyticum]|uniref:Glycosyl transferase family 28 C-terminal domain-containing protein n=1 Tax=Microbacterium trichothecenolyticum TaxID=69370 RepID=A0ABU0TXL5_MICTR|nr:hypothetical protein [Microbacterium trichothecenolyticum]MDQ1124400.1 hypothetical protein [Microbacterium trichothecenolyticum]